MKEEPAPSLLGRELGSYRILSLLGVGGMGEVYLARDSRLGRDVAIKVLPRDLASDPERRSRFEREARLLAALNHPNIATLHGVEEADGVPAIVLEWIEGPTLAERLTAGALPMREALSSARQITAALDAAHEKGIIHRDLKPGNIKMTAAGTIKVLDFGLAKAVAQSASHPDLSQTPTLAADDTREGVILGTAAYMSPEQARGLAVDKRTDLWALGCVLYEMLTGRRAFTGETVSDTLAAVLRSEPDCARLPGSTPPIVRRLLKRCLEKDPRERLRDAGDARFDLDEAIAQGLSSAAGVEERRSRRPGPPWPTAVAALAVLSILGTVSWMLLKGGDGPKTVTRSTVTLPANQRLDSESGASPLALSSDGRRLVYTARTEGRAQLFLRNLDAFEAQPLADTENAQYPFFSPDGQWIGFFADGKLKRVSAAGGAPMPVCDAARIGRGAAWGPDGTIVFDADAGLMRVPSEGGHPEPVAIQDATIDPGDIQWPQFLPDGRAILATLRPRRPVREQATLTLISLDSGESHELGPGSQATYLPPGYLVFHAPHVREGELHAAAFDLERLSLQGVTAAMLDGVFRARNAGAAYFALSQTGSLVYAPGGLAHTLVRVDRNGRRTPLSDDRRGFRFPRISPDGRRIAVTIDPRPSEIWIYDIARQSRMGLATEGHSIAPAWRPDGQRIDFSLGGDIHTTSAGGSGSAEPLLVREHPQYPKRWSSDGRFLVFDNVEPGTGVDVWVMPISGEPRLLVGSPANELNGTLSPDGKWLAYSSDESGHSEIYVRPFPNADAAKWVVSNSGGHSPLWSPDGHELFYMNGSAVMVAAVETRGEEFLPGIPTVLFDGPFDTTQDINFDISPDGTYFVMIEADPDARPTRLQLVLNWSEDLKRLTPPER